MNCGRSSSVEWKLPKLQRRVRFPSPAPAPPGRAPGGFVMATSHAPSTECGGTIGTTLSPRELGPAVPVQNSPCTPRTPPVPVQNSPSTPKISQFGAFYSRRASFIPFLSQTCQAWRILSRYHQQQDRHATSPGTKLTLHAQNLPIWRVLLTQGEFYPVFVANKPSMANFVPQPPTTRPARHQSRYKTHPARATIETMIGSEPQTTADRIQPSPSVQHPLPELEAPKFLGTATSATYGASRESPRNREVHQPRLALPPTVSSRMQSHLGQSLCQIHRSDSLEISCEVQG